MTFISYTARADIWEMFIPVVRHRGEGPAHSSILQLLWAGWAPVWANICLRCHSVVAAGIRVGQRAAHSNPAPQTSVQSICNGIKWDKSRFLSFSFDGDTSLKDRVGSPLWRVWIFSGEFCSLVAELIHTSICAASHAVVLWAASASSCVAEPPWVTMKSLPTLLWKDRSQERETAPCSPASCD